MPDPDIPSQDDHIAFALRLGRALQAYGTPAHRLEDAMEAVSRRLGLEAQFFGMPTGFIASFGEGHTGRTFVQRVPASSVDLAKLDATYAVTDALLQGRLDSGEAARRLDRLMDAPPRFRRLLQVAASGLVAACFGALLGGGWLDMGCAALLGAALGGLTLLTERSLTLARLHLVLSGALAAFGAQLLARASGHFSPSLAMLAGLIMLLPGISLTIGLNELAVGHLVSGTSRFAGALVVLLQLAFGVALGQKLGSLLHAGSGAAAAAPGWSDWVAILLAPIAITVLLKGRFRDLGWVWAAGFLAYGAARAGTAFLGPEAGLGLGALAGGLASNGFSRWRRRPSLLLLLPTLYLLTPGSVGFRSFASLAQSDVYSGMDAAFRTAFLAFALVTGLLIANAAFPPRRSL